MTDDREFKYLIWSNEHKAWWAPDSRGYTEVEYHAGRYTHAQAVARITQGAMHGRVEMADVMVVARWPACNLCGSLNAMYHEPGCPQNYPAVDDLDPLDRGEHTDVRK